MVRFRRLIEVLVDGNVDFVLVGGVAATVHGSARLTQDVDVVYSRDPANLSRLSAALKAHSPYPRGAPPNLPFLFDEETLRRGLNFTLTTDLGDLDLLGEITGGGGYEELAPHLISTQIYGFECKCLDLPVLIHVKRAAGRPKDLEAIAELEAILEEQQRR